MLNIQSFYLEECPLFSELPYKFNLQNFGQTGLDMLFFGQQYSDTMAILEDKRDIDLDKLNEMIKNQKILSNREVMLQNFSRLIDNLTECEEYIDAVLSGRQAKDANIARTISKCLSQFSQDDMSLLEQMVHTNFNDAMMTNNLAKL